MTQTYATIMNQMDEGDTNADLYRLRGQRNYRLIM